MAAQYVLGKLSDARERMSSDRIAKENLRRRFQQNQEDCTFTILALLPTATDNIMAELETERITFALQEQKASKLAREDRPSDLGSTPPSVTDDDGRSNISALSESGVHASQASLPPTTSDENAPQDAAPPAPTAQKSRKSKLQLWNDLKISAITRAFTLIYTLALLTLLTRIQLNLLGRRSYLSSVVSLATGGLQDSFINLENNDDDNTDQAYGNDFETNRRYLTFSWWLLHRGWREVMFKVQDAVQDVFGPLSPRDDLSLSRFSELTLEVRKRVEGATEADRQSNRWLQYLLPSRDQEDYVLQQSGMSAESPESTTLAASNASPLRRLLDETSDLIDSPSFTYVLTLLLDAGFSTLVDQKVAQQAFKVPAPPSDPNSQPRVQEIFDPKPMKLPIVLATLTRQAHQIGNGVPNDYLQAMELVGDLEAFAAVVYSSNWENEITPIGDDGAAKNGKAKESNGAGDQTESGILGGSIVDVGEASAFESAWGKATESSGGIFESTKQ
ncbi:hypothetical protein VE03_03219 [Pseudogymnoascus sp. 23342-1-I1]|nr:hypothetical protein VE03_03219 [Pseudogymnoascus sp. 23342-1-I1]